MTSWNIVEFPVYRRLVQPTIQIVARGGMLTQSNLIRWYDTDGKSPNADLQPNNIILNNLESFI